MRVHEVTTRRLLLKQKGRERGASSSALVDQSDRELALGVINWSAGQSSKEPMGGRHTTKPSRAATCSVPRNHHSAAASCSQAHTRRGPRHPSATHLDRMLRLKQAIVAHGAVATQALFHAAMLPEELKAHAGIARHAVEGVHSQALALQQRQKQPGLQDCRAGSGGSSAACASHR